MLFFVGGSERNHQKSRDDVFQKESSALRTIYSWIAKFQSEDFQPHPFLADDPRSGRPASAVTDENVN